jgi:predicted ArsR family transcriptional regulator
MDDLGFSPRTDEADVSHVRLTRCPFLEAAARHQEVVCAVHLGLARGVLAEHGVDPEGTRLLPFAEPGACRLVVPG